MKFKKYLKDKWSSILLTLITFTILLFLFLAFKVEEQLIISSFILLITLSILQLLVDYFRKRKFYTDLLSNVDLLDKSYLVLETLSKPEFYEGELLYQALYNINKSMNENVNVIKEQWNDFKEYIEMWIHEVKIPLATLLLITNNKDNMDKKIKIQLKRLEDFVDQVLYYARSENAEKDYLIEEVELNKIIKNVGLKNMDEILFNKMEYLVDVPKLKVLTDSKWLEFILEQIINNSIKYKTDRANSYIKISALDFDDSVKLILEDNGIGIKKSNIRQVFDKSFTGENGRIRGKSTGMGLYIAKKMCGKLGHKIEIESEENKYTKVIITIFKNDYFDVLK